MKRPVPHLAKLRTGLPSGAVDLAGRRSGEVAVVARLAVEAVGDGAERVGDHEDDELGVSALFDQEALRSLLARFGVEPRHSGGEPDTNDDETGEAFPAGLRPFDVMNQSLEAMQSVLTRYRLAGNPADLLITIPKDACRSFEFHRATEMITLGRTLATDALQRSTLAAGT
jgi:NTE family protein